MSKNTRRLREWAATVPPVLAHTAIMIANAAPYIWEALEELRHCKSPGRIPAPPPAKGWMKLYRNHRFIGELVGQTLGLDAEGELSADGIAAEVRNLSRMTRDERANLINGLSDEEKQQVGEIVVEARDALIDAIADQISDIEAEARGEILGDLEQAEKMMASAEIQFLFRVLVPCWIKHHIYPVELLRSARKGNIDGLEALLELDKTAVSDPKVLQQVHEAAHGGNQARFERIARAFGSKSIGRFNRQRIKRELAGLIGRMAEDSGHPMTEPKIRELFDAIAAIHGNQCDTDLPTSSETLSKALQRTKPEWASMIRRTKVTTEMSG